MKRVIFAVALAAAFGMFAWTVRRFLRMLSMGRPDVRTDRVEERVDSVLRYFFGQKKVVEKTSLPAKRLPRFVSALGSKYHFLIFWGFIIITIGTGETLVQGLFPSFSLTLFGKPVAHAIYWMVDWSTLIVLAVILFAFVRRTVLQPRLIPLSRDASAILGAIAMLMVTHFGIHALRGVAEGRPEAGYPVSASIGDALSFLPTGAAGALSEASWWLHVLIVLAFLNYLLYSKHSHILAALPNIFFRKLGQRGILPKLNMEADDMASTGVVSEWKDFTWKSLLDGYACTECARCSNFCPAYNTGKPLSPMQVIHDVRDDMRTRMSGRGPLDVMIDRFQHGGGAQADTVMPLIGGRTTEDVLWACTTCGACQEVCPVFIDHPEKILQMRQNLVLVQEKVPPDLARTFTNLERNGNPWGIGADKRMDWAEGHDVPTLDDKPDAEYLLWVGCAGAYDDRIKKQTLALVDVLREGGVDFAVLGLEEGCTGDPARRSGNEMLYQMQAQQNVETMNAKKVKKVITACPHCLHTIKNEYPQLGGNFEVRHHTQVIRELVESGKVEIDKAELASEDRAESGAAALSSRKIAFHDPCYLGRWNGEYDAPRAVLDGLPPRTSRIELSRNKEHGFCCGAGGGRMWMEEKIGTRVNHNRTDEIIASGADTVATACPFCTIMLRDGVQDRGAGEKVQVLNVSELVAKSMKRKRELEGSGALQGAKSPSE
ncbi:MAG TPA: (Fe-S)-binding protein [Polyangia bacterium]|nr:(Fe-S)-binding protein [Polyangia bacterium]